MNDTITKSFVSEILFSVFHRGIWCPPTGYVLYSNGDLYSYKPNPNLATLDSLDKELPLVVPDVLITSDVQLAEAVANLIKDNENEINALPEYFYANDVFDANTTEIIFGKKHCGGYAVVFSQNTEKIIYWHNKILKCIQSFGYLVERTFWRWEWRRDEIFFPHLRRVVSEREKELREWNKANGSE